MTGSLSTLTLSCSSVMKQWIGSYQIAFNSSPSVKIMYRVANVCGLWTSVELGTRLSVKTSIEVLMETLALVKLMWFLWVLRRFKRFTLHYRLESVSPTDFSDCFQKPLISLLADLLSFVHLLMHAHLLIGWFSLLLAHSVIHSCFHSLFTLSLNRSLTLAPHLLIICFIVLIWFISLLAADWLDY